VQRAMKASKVLDLESEIQQSGHRVARSRLGLDRTGSIGILKLLRNAHRRGALLNIDVAHDPSLRKMSAGDKSSRVSGN